MQVFENLATFTDYTGFDPEVGASTQSANVFGLDNGPLSITSGIYFWFKCFILIRNHDEEI